MRWPVPEPWARHSTKLLATTGSGVIQLDWRGRIVAANDRALRMLRTGDALFDEDGFLSARSPEDDADLQRLLTRALPPCGGRGSAGSMTARGLAAPEPLVLHLHPVGRKDTEYRAWPVAALMLVVDPGNQTPIDPHLVAATLDLTPMESRVATLLAEGLTVGQIASATRAQDQHHPYARTPHLRQARNQPPSGPCAARAVDIGLASHSALTAAGALRRR